MKKHEMEKRIEAALNSLDHMARVGPGPFFYTRVRARFESKDRTLWEKISGFLAKPAIALTVISLIVSLNTLVIYQSEKSPAITDQYDIVSSDESEFDIIAFYEEENNNTDPR